MRLRSRAPRSLADIEAPAGSNTTASPRIIVRLFPFGCAYVNRMDCDRWLGFNADRGGPRSLFYPLATHIENAYCFRNVGWFKHRGVAERNQPELRHCWPRASASARSRLRLPQSLADCSRPSSQAPQGPPSTFGRRASRFMAFWDYLRARARARVAFRWGRTDKREKGSTEGLSDWAVLKRRG